MNLRRCLNAPLRTRVMARRSPRSYSALLLCQPSRVTWRRWQVIRQGTDVSRVTVQGPPGARGCLGQGLGLGASEAPRRERRDLGDDQTRLSHSFRVQTVRRVMAVMLTGQGIYLVSRRSQPLSQPAVRLVLSLVWFWPAPGAP